MRNKIRNSFGFTMIEIIGVLAVISILAALVAPKIFDTIADSKVSALASDIRGYSAGVQDWYSDIGTMRMLDTNGNPLAFSAGSHTGFDQVLASRSVAVAAGANGTVAGNTGLWTRYRGPYIDQLKSTAIADGITMNSVDLVQVTAGGNLPTAVAVSKPVAGTAYAGGWDIDGNAKADLFQTVIVLQAKNVAEDDWVRLENILDANVGTASTREITGRVMFSGTMGSAAQGDVVIIIGQENPPTLQP